MKKYCNVLTGLLFICLIADAQQKSTVKEYRKAFTTYPFSDPDPVPEFGKIYPYYRFDGYTNTPVQKEWKVVELENEYVRLMILPEIGGKIWSAIEKSTGKSFIYDNKTVKFRDVAMRGPWTSGGIEANYGIIGHTPNCATPVDYTTIERPDGSVSCVIGVLDLLTRTSWRIDINLAKDKAYFTTSSFWYNSSSFEESYYTWMNTGLRAKGNLQFIYPGTKYIGHEGEFSDWPINKQNGKDISFYENNNFGGYKSYHVFGKYADFFGGYWHDEDFGMGRYSTHDDKPGKKIWIWGLSDQGMIWDKLLTDTNGQYVEVQSGRLFNQAAEGSTFTPFKHKGFLPHTTDTWTEYWFPVLKTKGFVVANNYGSLNLKPDQDLLRIYFSPLQQIDDELKITDGDKVVYSKTLRLKPLELFADSIKISTNHEGLVATLGKNKLKYEFNPTANDLSRPVVSPADFDWKSAYGLYLLGKENIRQRYYKPAEQQLRASLEKEPYYMPALTDLSMILYRDMRYEEALEVVKKALSVDTYDPAANYYYGLINTKLGNSADAKDGLDIASMATEFRSAAFTSLANLYLKENNLQRAVDYAVKSINFNKYAVDAYQLLSVASRLQDNKAQALKILDTLQSFDPLNHFAGFERYLLQPTEENKKSFMGLIRNEMPYETYLELAVWYYNAGRNADASALLQLAPSNAEILYWQAFLEDKPLDTAKIRPDWVFPFRSETAEVLKALIKKNDLWVLKFHLALIQANYNNLSEAKQLFDECGDTPAYAPFYAARANFNFSSDSILVLKDLLKASAQDKSQWRYGKELINYYLSSKQYTEALNTAADYQKRFPASYIIGQLYAKSLLLNKQYSASAVLLQKIKILPNEGATEGHQLYKESFLMLALEQLNKKKYKKSLQYVQTARLWPESLGAGKPYDEDVDSRLEDWIAYQNYNGMGNKQAAKQTLDKITSAHVKKGKRDQIGSSANNLVTAWALKQSGQEDKALEFLKSWLDQDPGNAMATWVTNAYKGNYVEFSGKGKTDENYRVLESWKK